MILLRPLLQAHLRTIHDKVYFLKAPDNANFPYLVYDLPTVLDDGEFTQRLTLEVDGWDLPESGSTTPLETLMRNVNKNLNKITLTSDDLAVSFYLDRKLVLDDDNPKIIRRKYIYEGHLFERSEK